jgi:hypothetical protein
MAGGKSQYLNNKFLNLVFNATAYTAASPIFCALYTVTPSDTTSGTEVANTNGYARVSIVPNNTNFGTSTLSTLSNSVAIIFPTATTGGWGTIVAAAFLDLATYGGGNMLYWGPLGSSVTVNVGNTFEFLAAGFSASES